MSAAATISVARDPVVSAAERLGVHSFRLGQRELIDAVLSGRDALGVLPTGSGKSLCYELPALLASRPVVVVSPLIALMKDQCEHLAHAHVLAAELDSTLTAGDERIIEREIRAGVHPIIYVTPERFTSDGCIAMLRQRGVSLIAVDEAHCVSQWGHDFRPAYLGIARAAEQLGRPPIMALTATATKETANDIANHLGLRAPCVVRASVTRANLVFRVERTVNEMVKRAALIRIVDAELGPGQGVGIVYAATVNMVDELYAWLAAMRVPVARYHGQMTPKDREESRVRFMRGDVQLMVATKAFGMGIDKPDIRVVVHHQFPDSIESYVQEAGRAGRDGADARCVLLYRLEDKRVQTFFLARKYPSRRDVEQVRNALRSGVGGADTRALAQATKVPEHKVKVIVAHFGASERREAGDLTRLADAFAALSAAASARLDAMMHYADRRTCRASALASYFGEPAATTCGRCDVCSP